MGIFDKIGGRVGDILDEVMISEDTHRAHEAAAQAIAAERFQDALDLLGRAAVEKPGIARTHYLMGRAHAGKLDWKPAIESYERAFSIREQPPTLVQLAQAFEQARQLRESERRYLQALEMEGKGPWREEAHFGLGRVYLAMRRADKALKELRHAARLADEPSDVLQTQLAKALWTRGDFDDARLELQKVQKHSPESLLLQARVEESCGDAAASLAIFQELASGDSPDVRALIGVSRLLLERGNYAQAAQFAERAIEAGSGDARIDGRILLGEAFAAMGQTDSAEGQFTEARAAAPDNARAAVGHGSVQFTKGDIEAARTSFESALHATASNVLQKALLGLGKCRRKTQDLAGARLALEEALRHKTSENMRRSIQAELAELALEAGDVPQAVYLVQQAQADGEDPRLKAILHEALENLRPQWELPETVNNPLELKRVLVQLLAHTQSDVRLPKFVPRIQKLITQLDAPLSLAIVGEFNAGKSTIVNSLIGESVLPTGVLPTTAHSGIIRFGPRKAAQVFFVDGRIDEVTFAEAKVLMKTNADEIDHLQFIYPHPSLRTVEFWDTPGFNAVNPRHEEIAREALAEAEAILWVMDANQVLSQTEFDLIDQVPDAGERLVVVINKVDRLGRLADRHEQVEELLEYVDENLEGAQAGTFAISALNALDPDQPAEESGFDDFKDFLDLRIVQRAGRIKTLDGSRHMLELVRELVTFRDTLISDYQEHLNTVEGLRVWLHGQAASSAERAKHTVQDLSDQIDFVLEGLESEITEALRPTTSLLNTKLQLGAEDRRYLLELLDSRIQSVAMHGFTRQTDAIARIEAHIAAGFDPVLRGSSTSDNRVLQGRLDGFFDDSRTLQRLLEEKAFGHMLADSRGRIEVSGEMILDAIEATQGNPELWRGTLRKLVPRLAQSLESRLTEWYIEFFENAYRLLLRVHADLRQSCLEAEYRYDLRALVELLEQGEQPK